MHIDCARYACKRLSFLKIYALDLFFIALEKIALEKDSFLNMQEIGRTFLKEGSIGIEEYKRILILD